MYYGNANKIGVVPIAAIISVTAKALPALVPFFRGAFQSPAKDARAVIDTVKQQITSQDARARLATVIAGSQQNARAADVDVNEMLFWYRQNYPNDYLQLNPEDKAFWNSYLDNYRQRFLLQRPDLQNNFLNRSYFTKEQVNCKPQTPGAPGTPGTQRAGMNIWVTLGIVGAGIFLITKMKK
jgi:hypothetical protein